MLMRMRRRWTEKSVWDNIFILAILIVVHGEMVVAGVADWP